MSDLTRIEIERDVAEAAEQRAAAEEFHIDREDDEDVESYHRRCALYDNLFSRRD
jgi:hypothetical protein